MGEIDVVVLQDSMKALYVIFIITIFISSIALLYKLVRIQDDTFNLRRIVVGILACGTLLFSLFPLVVDARIQFEPFGSVECKTMIFSTIFESFFFPFVYAISLISLAIELYMAKRGSTPPQPLFVRVAYVTSPWILAIIIVLPLKLSGSDLEICAMDNSWSRHRASVWVCNLLPACAVLAAAIFLAFKVGGDDGISSVHHYTPNMAPSISTQRVVQSNSSSSSYSGAFQQPGYTSNNANQHSGVVLSVANPNYQQRPDSSHFHQPPPYEYNPSTSPHPNVSYQPHQQQFHHQQPEQPVIMDTKPPSHHHRQQQQLPQQQQQQHIHQPPPQYPPPPPPNYAPPPPGFGTPFYEYDAHNRQQHLHHQHHHPNPNLPQSQSFSHPQVINGPQTNTGITTIQAPPAVRDLRDEAKAFAKVAALFVFLSLPQAIFNLAYLLNKDRVVMGAMAELVIIQLVSWFAVLRWLVLNICWCYSIK